jgi:hypothetical protein
MMPKVGNKLWSMVIRKPMEAKDFLDEEVGSLRGLNGFRTEKEMSHLGKAIFDNKDEIQILREREVSDEVQRNMCPGCIGNFKRVGWRRP